MPACCISLLKLLARLARLANRMLIVRIGHFGGMERTTEWVLLCFLAQRRFREDQALEV